MEAKQGAVKTVTKQVAPAAKGVLKGAGAGALMGLGTAMLGPLLGPVAGAIGAGALLGPNSRDIIALIAGMEITKGLFGGAAAETTI